MKTPDWLRFLLPLSTLMFHVKPEEEALLAQMAEGEGEATGTQNENRLAKLSRIGVSADIERADQLMDIHDDDTTTPFVPGPVDENGDPVVDTEAEAARVEAETEAARVAAEAEAAAAKPEVHKRKIKINGVEKELTFEEIDALAQKAAAADDKFQEAARLREEAKNLAAAKPPVKDVPADDIEEMRALARAIQVGDEEEAVAALRKLKGTATPPALGELYSVIDAKLAFNDANRIFREEFSDLVSDPRLERMVMERDAEVIAAGDKRPYLERYREIGGEVRAWRESIAGKPAPAADPLAAKEARKAAAPAVPPAASGKAPQAKSDEDEEESVQQTIAKMSKARGGPQWLRS